MFKVFVVLFVGCPFSYGQDCPWSKLPPVLPLLNGRVTAGVKIDIEIVSYQISIQRNGLHICTGVIISSNWFLCPAHSVTGYTSCMLSVRAGSNTPCSGGILRQVDQLILHPNFNACDFDYDLALGSIITPFYACPNTPRSLKVKVDIDVNIKAITLANIEPTVGASVSISGWGSLSNDLLTFCDYILLRVEVAIMARKKCQGILPVNLLTNRMSCTDMSRCCMGDPGGPIVVNGELVGIVSWGRGCPDKNIGVGVHATITNANIRSWIKLHVGI